VSPIYFHFDYVSPYAYVAWKEIHELAECHGCEVVPVPTLFAALLNAGQTKGPAEIPAKRRYIFKDILRTCRALALPILPPASHPFNPLVALRASCIEMPKDEKRRLVDALYDACWGRGGSIETPPDVARALVAGGFEASRAEAIASRVDESALKAALRQNTEHAIAEGVFGVPTMRVDGELFWGFDSFPNLERHLEHGTDVDPALAERFLALRATAERVPR
jgi:2-hydroxychromene-2-carboxylate isomerase